MMLLSSRFAFTHSLKQSNILLLHFSINYRGFSVKIEINNLTVSNTEIILLDFTVSKIWFS